MLCDTRTSQISFRKANCLVWNTNHLNAIGRFNEFNEHMLQFGFSLIQRPLHWQINKFGLTSESLFACSLSRFVYFRSGEPSHSESLAYSDSIKRPFHLICLSPNIPSLVRCIVHNGENADIIHLMDIRWYHVYSSWVLLGIVGHVAIARKFLNKNPIQMILSTNFRLRRKSHSRPHIIHWLKLLLFSSMQFYRQLTFFLSNWSKKQRLL